ADIRKMVSEGKVGFADLQRALASMAAEGGFAFNGMAKQSETLGGLWSTFKDNVGLALTDVGNAIVENLNLKDALKSMIDYVKAMASDWIPKIVEGIKWMVSFATTIK